MTTKTYSSNCNDAELQKDANTAFLLGFMAHEFEPKIYIIKREKCTIGISYKNLFEIISLRVIRNR